MYSIRTQGKSEQEETKWFFIRERSMWSRPKIAFLVLFVLFLARCVFLASAEMYELGMFTHKYSVVREDTFISSVQSDESTGVSDTGGVVPTSTERGDASPDDSVFPDPCTLEDVVCEGEGDIETVIIQTFPENPRIAIAIAKAESAMNPSRIGDLHITFDEGRKGMSCGLFQVRVLEGRPECGELLNIETNLEWARKIYDERGDWTAWSTYNNGRYLSFM